MNIVILDGYTLNPGDLDWASIETLGNLTVYDRTTADEFAGRAAAADLLLVNKFVLNRERLALVPNLRYIGVTATGYNNIDLAAARERGITVCNAKGYSNDSVAQLTFGLLLDLAYHTSVHIASVRAGDWQRQPDFCYWKAPLVELAGKTLGIVGFGDIGRKVAQIGQAFSMNILVNRRQMDDTPPEGITYADIPTLFAQSDVVSLHCPLTQENREFVNRDLLSRMKPSAFLINTGRGPLIQEADLADALNAGRLAGAGLDVLSVEPPQADNPLLSARNCRITPHIAWASYEARRRLMAITAENIKAFLDGRPQNVVS